MQKIDPEEERVRSIFFFMGIMLFSAVFSLSVVSGQESGKGMKIKVSSPAFGNDKTIPSKYGCDGSNVNPPVKIENVPPGANSLALVFDDKDAPRGTYVHWVLWNIDPSVREIHENSVPVGAIQGTNDFKKNAYGGPCPPTRPHKYVLIVYALDVRLNLEPKSGKADLEKAMEGHIIAQGQLMGVYKREKKK
jgi:Raf kinase inhibitor-like YbhB/YbcL family protein